MNDLNQAMHNVVRVSVQDLQGKVIHAFAAKNGLTYAAASVIMTALIQSGPFQVTHLYARYAASAPAGRLIVQGQDLRGATRNDFVRTVASSTSGAVWVPTLAAPKQTSSDPNLYTGNVATYYFRIPGTPAVGSFSGPGLDETKKIYALGLAVATNVLDRTQDIIIATLQDFTPFQVPASGQITVDYPLQFSVNISEPQS